MSHGFTPFVDLLEKFPPWSFAGETLFDAGTGFGELGFYLKAVEGHPRVKFRGRPRLIGCDLDADKVRRASQVYDECYKWDLRVQPYSFLREKPKFTCCLEVLEHFPEGKAESLRVLSYLEGLSPNIVVGVPHGDHRINHVDHPLMNHYSVWWPEDFSDRGYEVHLLDLVGLSGRSLAAYQLLARARGRPRQHILAIKASPR